MEEVLFETKYRPSTVSGTILPIKIKEAFQAYVEAKEIPNLILSGPAGVGKTTIAIAAITEIGSDYIKINAALERGIDMIREKLIQFASTVSFNGGRKYVILDEADGISATAQEALKAFIEEYSSNCGFILTCNNSKKIIAPIHSRCNLIEIKPSKEEFIDLGKQFLRSLYVILDKENIPYDRNTIVLVIKKFYPDWRQVLVQLQSYAVHHKKIDRGILGVEKNSSSNTIIEFLKSKRWTDMRMWVGENFSFLDDFHIVAGDLIRTMEPIVEPKCMPDLIILLNEYDYKNSFVQDKELNLVAFLTQVMNDTVWK